MNTIISILTKSFKRQKEPVKVFESIAEKQEYQRNFDGFDIMTSML